MQTYLAKKQFLCLIQHIKLANYQTKIWKMIDGNCDIPDLWMIIGGLKNWNHYGVQIAKFCPKMYNLQLINF